VLKVGKDNKTEECRIGLEPGDTFVCDDGTLAGFYPTSFIKIFPVMEALRCEGDLRFLGASATHTKEFICPDGPVQFKITGIKQE
jgi:uncharacterized repeat protein (TIGR04076 family)